MDHLEKLMFGFIGLLALFCLFQVLVFLLTHPLFTLFLVGVIAASYLIGHLTEVYLRKNLDSK